MSVMPWLRTVLQLLRERVSVMYIPFSATCQLPGSVHQPQADTAAFKVYINDCYPDMLVKFQHF